MVTQRFAQRGHEEGVSPTSRDGERGDRRAMLAAVVSAGLGGGVSGFAAMALQVGVLMWARTVINSQMVTGRGFVETACALYAEGGVARFYRGVWLALLLAPLSRFGDAAANQGMLVFLAPLKVPVVVKTGAASCCAALWRVAIFPLDTLKTMLQIGGAESYAAAIALKVGARGHLALFDGAGTASAAALVGHWPWFATNNLLEARVRDWGPRWKHARRAAIGFSCSAVSDTVSNGVRVLKITIQTSPVPIGVLAAARHVVETRGLGGLLWTGLPAKLVCNGISSVFFSVIWKMMMDRRQVQGKAGVQAAATERLLAPASSTTHAT